MRARPTGFQADFPAADGSRAYPVGVTAGADPWAATRVRPAGAGPSPAGNSPALPAAAHRPIARVLVGLFLFAALFVTYLAAFPRESE